MRLKNIFLFHKRYMHHGHYYESLLEQSIHYNVAFKVVFAQFAYCRNHVTITSEKRHVLSDSARARMY